MTPLSTPDGSVLGNSFETDGTTVHRFLGIPYAEPPSGSNRFRPPVPVSPWSGVLDCTAPGPAAPQNPESHAPPGTTPRTWSEEACLNLNIWTPATEGPARPVMVWIHGGAYLMGANSDAMYDGARLAAAAGVVLVSINYRLGALGFLHLADLLGPGYADSSNLALLDQLEALRWIRRNIGAFGGDPHNVTIFGESAGAAAIGTLLGMPASEGLFRRAIMQSGTAERCRRPEDSARISATFLELCGLDASSANQLLTLPVERLLEAQAALEQRAAAESFAVPLPFQPTVGTPSLPLPPLESIGNGVNFGVDLLIGTNLNEGSFAVEMRPDTGSDPGYPDRAAAVLCGAGCRRRLPPAIRRRSPGCWAGNRQARNSWKPPSRIPFTASPATGCWTRGRRLPQAGWPTERPVKEPPGRTSPTCSHGAARPWAGNWVPATPWTSHSSSGTWTRRRPPSSHGARHRCPSATP
ncbi:carboxylesterase/lipase family protein [Arthrobacter sp. FX8]|uniref:carboxylesterase/lipase family protein n=1 Tax=Arthrobacter sp. FX8 TaxID=2997335 RepID=UPI002DD6622E|nr:carboxylesterase family protein [Arthrobacter sp. FX8]